MKVLMVVMLLVSMASLASSFSFARSSATMDRPLASPIQQRPKRLEVSLVASKLRYKRNGEIKLEVRLVNSGHDNLFVFGTLEWGPSASFTLHLRDALGKEVQPRVFADDLTPPISPDDKSAFVKLVPQHFLGTYLRAPLDLLYITKPGRYAIFVDYRCPILTSDVNLNPFWGKESGTIKSNVVYIEVLR